MTEEWRDILGYEGYYQVSNLGRVMSIRNKKLLNFGNSRGYYNVTFSVNGKARTFTVHRLVAECFIPNPDNKPLIDYIDTDIHNNAVSNLRWSTASENNSNPITVQKQRLRLLGTQLSQQVKEKIRQKAIGRKVPLEQRLRRSRAVLCVETGMIYYSANEAQRKTGIRSGNISKVCKGLIKHTGGYSWRYADENK